MVTEKLYCGTIEVDYSHVCTFNVIGVADIRWMNGVLNDDWMFTFQPYFVAYFAFHFCFTLVFYVSR